MTVIHLHIRQIFSNYYLLNQCIGIVFLGFFSTFIYAQSPTDQKTTPFTEPLAQLCYESSLKVNTGAESLVFKDIEDCDEALRSVSLNAQDRAATYVNRATLYVALGNTERALQDYNQALTVRDDLPEIYLNRGNLHLIQGKYQDAINDYNKSIQLGISQKHIALLNRGNAYEQMGSIEQAEQNYLAALDEAPNWAPVMERLTTLSR